MRIYSLLLPVVSLALLFSCKKPVSEAESPEIKVSPESQALFASGITFSAEANPSSPLSTTIHFTATDEWKAEVSDTKASSWLGIQPSDGKAGAVSMTVSAQPNTAEMERKATITLQCGTDKKSISVRQAAAAPVTVDVESVTLDKEELTLEPGGTFTLTATVLPENATDKTVSWSSADPEVAAVENGTVTALAEGESLITAKAGKQEATCKVVVEKGFVTVTSISLDKETLVLEENESSLLTATVLPEDATDKTVSWSSSDSDVATVTDGRVTALKEGSATITAQAGEQKATCQVIVKKHVIPVTSVTLDKTTIALQKGETEVLTAIVQPDDATDKTLSWSSSDASVASVDQNGKVSALKGGQATITAKAGDQSATCQVTVTVPVESVTLDHSSCALEEGQSITLVATVLPEDATDKTVSWSSSDASVATVTDGKVTAVKEGSATITAQAGNQKATCQVTVKKQIVAVTSITLNKTTLSLKKNESEILTAIVQPDDATDKTVSWASSDASVASVDQNGKVSALQGGQATITAKAGDQSATCQVTVTVPVESVTLDHASCALEEGQSITLVATVLPEDATDKTLIWSSSDASVATVTDGKVTAVKEGSATITARAGDQKATCQVTVKKQIIAVTSITLNKTTLSLKKNESEILTAIVKPDDATDRTVSWASSDASVASVDQNGKVSALKGGQATITAKAGDQSATCLVTVTVPVESVTLDHSSCALEEGQSITLVATVLPEDATDKTVSWSSSDASVATVTDGKVTAVKEGSATITAQAGDQKASCQVTVYQSAIAVTGVSLDRTDITLIPGGVDILYATVYPADATNKTVTWSSSDNNVATVSGGIVTAVGVGSAVVSVKTEDGGFTAGCSVTVQEAPVATGLSVENESITLPVGESLKVTVTPTPANAACSMQWSSSNERVVKVSGMGYIGQLEALDFGTATITATDSRSGLSVSFMVATTVSDFAWTENTGESYQGSPLLTLKKGQTHQLQYSCSPANVTGLFADLSQLAITEDGKVVDKPSCITLTTDGEVTALSAGMVQLTPQDRITASTGRGTLYIKVTPEEYDPEGDNEDIGYEDWN